MTVASYGVNISGCLAMIEAGRRKVKGELIGPPKYKGGMSATGLGQTDREGTALGAPSTSLRMGLSAELERRYGLKSNSAPHLFPNMRVVTEVLNEMLAEVADYVTVNLGKELESVEQDGDTGRLRAFTAGGRRIVVTGAVDDTDELDLARRLNCLTDIGRKSVKLSGLSTDGVRPPSLSTGLAYNPATGERYYGIHPRPAQAVGVGDRRMMAFCMRSIWSQDANRLQFQDAPVTPDPRLYDGDLSQAVAMKYKTVPASVGRGLLPNDGIEQHDANNGGQVRLGLNDIGGFLDWPASNWTGRRGIITRYIIKKAGLFKTIVTDSEWARLLPELVADTKTWGFVPNLWTDSYIPGWSPDIYVRKANRMRSRTDLRFRDCFVPEVNSIAEPVFLGGYPHVDSHPVQRFAHETGYIAIEGGGGLDEGLDTRVTQMPLGALQARPTDCPNLMVSRGVGGGNLDTMCGRIELVYQKNGQVCGMVLALADQNDMLTSQVSYEKMVRPALDALGYTYKYPGVA